MSDKLFAALSLSLPFSGAGEKSRQTKTEQQKTHTTAPVWASVLERERELESNDGAVVAAAEKKDDFVCATVLPYFFLPVVVCAHTTVHPWCCGVCFSRAAVSVSDEC